MIGCIKSVRCPYCKKTYEQDLGVTQFYDYRGISVIITNHGCGEFIGELGDTFREAYLRYNLHQFNPTIRNNVMKIVYDNINRVMDEVDMTKIVAEELYNTKQEVDIKFDNLKVLVEICMNYATIPLFSMPLTDEVKKELKPDHIVCF